MRRPVSETEIRNIIRDEIKKALEEFLIKLRLELLPHVSQEEQKEIESLYREDLLKRDDENIAAIRKLDLWTGK